MKKIYWQIHLFLNFLNFSGVCQDFNHNFNFELEFLDEIKNLWMYWFFIILNGIES